MSINYVILLSCDYYTVLTLQYSPHPPLFLNDTIIPETSTAQVLGFTFDSLLTWESYILRMLNLGKQRVSKLYRVLFPFYKSTLVFDVYRSWIRPTLEYGNILYSGAVPSHVRRLENLQTRIERTCCSTFESLLHCHHAAIIGFVCCLLVRERPAQCFAELLTSVAGLAVFISGTLQAMHCIDPCNFQTLDRCRCNWQVSALHLLNSLPADILLRGDTNGWCNILKQAQRHVATV